MHKLLWFIFVTLPFTYALTLDVGFPLKIYELAAIFLIFTLFVHGCLNGNLKVIASRDEKEMFYILGSFLLTYVASAVFGIIILQINLSTFPAWAVGRFSPYLSPIFKILYLALDILVFLIIIRYAKGRLNYYIKAWLLGGILASIYAWHLFIFSIFKLSPFLLPGMKEPLQVIGGVFNVPVIRSGTFLEGNFMGSYLLLSVVLSFYMLDLFRRKKYLFLAVFFAFTLLTTFSTVNLLALMFVLSMYVIHTFSRIQSGILKPVLIGAGTIVIFLFLYAITKTSYAQKYVQEKFFGTDKTEITLSRDDRIDQAITGLRIFSKYPLIGVGPGNYGFYYPIYRGGGYFVEYSTNYNDDKKKIPNNIYVELLSELGIIGFGIFTLFLISIYLRSRICGLESLRYGILALLFVFLAFPTYTIVFLWAFWGLILGISERVRSGSCSIGAPRDSSNG